ncbi:L-idonate 5-dehydrogenase [Devosia sp.]|uniref:L-idonate 5-dehydrogenase n=1 Tax=Devosia sp. TaxID=1871048 RepID=UPI0032632574
MKAVVIHAARDLRLEDWDMAAIGAGQVGIAIAAGGICGSDLHYYQHGGFGAVRLREPMVLGHEVAGTVSAVGSGVAGLKSGDRVAVSPSLPCNRCEYCLKGQQNQCFDMRFYGSAMRMPHVHGAFRQQLVADASQCHQLADSTTFAEGAFAEPLAVTLHAVNRAGSMLNKRVLVTGSGPIGALCILAARAHGAREIVVTDIHDAPLAYADAVGADRTINVATSAEQLAEYAVGKGSFDVMFECSGNAAALTTGINVLRPRSVLIQLGLGGEMSLPQNLVVSKEIEIRGSFRFHEEFALAVDLINQRRVDVNPLLTDTFGIDDAVAAFEAAGDRSRTMKVQLAFS